MERRPGTQIRKEELRFRLGRGLEIQLAFFAPLRPAVSPGSVAAQHLDAFQETISDLPAPVDGGEEVTY